MQLKTEEIHEKQKVLFLYKYSTPAIDLFKKKLERNQFEIFSSTRLPNRLEYFNFIYIFDNHKIETIVKNTKAPVFIILFNDLKAYESTLHTIKTNNHTLLKVVHIDKNHLESISENQADELIEQIVWFLLTKSSEQGLNLARTYIKKEVTPKTIKKNRLRKRKIAFWIISIFIFSQIFFIFPLIISSFFLYKSVTELKRYNLEKTKNYLDLASPALTLTKHSYQLSRPVLSFLYVGNFTDNIISLEDTSYEIMLKSINMNENAKQIVSLLLNKSKSDEEIKTTAYRIQNLRVQIKDINSHLNTIIQKLDYPFEKTKNIRSDLKTVQTSVDQIQEILNDSEYLFGDKVERKYLLLFQNNMEIRPGGGFIGSYGILTMKDYTLKEFKVQDVYEADGQLRGHVDPPDPIRTYLHQPNWFLRDSGFSPDFPENLTKAQFFLEKEMNLTNFDGGMAITTTAINTIIGAFGDIYLPDYNETINKDNFYIKTQTQTEKGFFPGSSQKRSYLSSLTNALLLKLETDVSSDFLSGVKKGLDEKQIVLFFKNDNIQKTIDKAGWSGKFITPQCAITIENCILDSFFAVDANLGVNKANFFLQRYQDIRTHIDTQGKIRDTATLLFKNNSSYETFPGGTYKNYLQVYIPRDSKLISLTKNNIKVEKFDEKDNGAFRIIGFYFEVKPKTQTTIQLNYELSQVIKKGRNGYQLVVQKQIGSTNNDLHLEFTVPKNIFLINKNFSALAKDNQLIYNTSLTTDKIFFIELLKE